MACILNEIIMLKLLEGGGDMNERSTLRAVCHTLRNLVRNVTPF